MKKRKVFVISGPGGAGKTTLVEKLFREKEIIGKFSRGIAVTTRPIRPEEEDGKDYFFVTKDEFLRLKKKRFFLESQKIVEHYYGTPKLFYIIAKRKKKDLILCIDVKGGIYLKKNFKDGKIITIFVTAPTEKDLYRRMKKRAEEKGMMKKRVELAKKELSLAKHYDYSVTNKSVKSSLKKIEAIILEHH